METNLVIGEFYTIRRITGKVVDFKLVEFDYTTNTLTYEETYYKGLGVFCNLSEGEIKSIRRIEKQKQ